MLTVLRDIVSYMALPLSCLTGFFSMQVTLRFLKLKNGAWRIMLFYIIHVILFNQVVYLGVAHYFEPLFVIFVFVGTVCLFCEGSLLAKLSVSMTLVIIPISLNAIFASFRPPFDRFFYLYIALFWGSVFLFVSKGLKQSNRPLIHTPRLWGLIDLLLIMPFGATFASLILAEPIPLGTNEDPFYDTLYIQNEKVLVIILCLSVIASLSILIAIMVLSRHEELEESALLWQVRSQYYQNLEEAQQQVRQLRHDMANHLTVLARLEGASSQQYIEQLVQSPAMKANQHYCDNTVVNAVLSAKMPVVYDKEIKSDLDIRLPKQLPLSEVDLCAFLQTV